MADVGEDLKAALKAKLTRVTPGSAARRNENDRKHKLAEDDGRRGKRGGVDRDEQINFKAPKGTQARVAVIARAQGISRVAAFMKMLADAEAKHGIKP